MCILLGVKRWLNRPSPEPGAVTVWLRILALLLAFAILPTRFVQEASPDWRPMNLLLSSEVVGLTIFAVYLAGGRAWMRHFAFPVGFILVAVPWPFQIESAVIQHMTRTVTLVTVEALTNVGIVATNYGNVIETSQTVVGVDEACSGVQSLQATLMAALALGELWSLGGIRRGLLVIIGIVMAFAFNLVRAFWLAWTAHHHGANSISSWHDPAGFTILGVTFVSLFLLSLLLRPKREAPTSFTVAGFARTLPRSLVIGLGAWLVVATVAIELWYRAHENKSAATWAISLPPSDALDFKPVEISERIRNMLQFDSKLAASWKDSIGNQWLLFYFEWKPREPLSRILARAHRPEICLPGSGITKTADRGVRPIRVAGVELPFYVYVFDRNGQPMYVYFLLTEDGASSALTPFRTQSFRRFDRIQMALDGKRNLGQRSLEILLFGPKDTVEADAALERNLQSLIRQQP